MATIFYPWCRWWQCLIPLMIVQLHDLMCMLICAKGRKFRKYESYYLWFKQTNKQTKPRVTHLPTICTFQWSLETTGRKGISLGEIREGRTSHQPRTSNGWKKRMSVWCLLYLCIFCDAFVHITTLSGKETLCWATVIKCYKDEVSPPRKPLCGPEVLLLCISNSRTEEETGPNLWT